MNGPAAVGGAELPTERTPSIGRPRAGLNGEAVSRYPQLSSRLPPETLARLRALAAVQGRPLWRVVVDAIQAYEDQHPEFATATEEPKIFELACGLPAAQPPVDQSFSKR